MKLRIFTIILTVLVISMTLVSCLVTLPLNDSSSETDKSSSPAESSEPGTSGDPVSVPEDSTPDTSPEQSPDPASQDVTHEESSEPPVEESSTPPVEQSSEPPVEQSSEPPAPVSKDPVEESSEHSREPVSQPEEYDYIPDVPGLPYTSYEGMTKSKLTASEYDAYFKDSMFIGLSIFVHFSTFNETMLTKYPGFLGNTIIFARSNFSAYNNFRYKPTDEDSVHPKLNGVKMTCEDAVKVSGVKTVYLSLMALNELGIYKDDCVKKTYDSTVKLINAIKAKSPSVEIVILSNTYMVYDFNNFKNLNNGNISALNNMMLDYCNEHGMDFIDVSTMLMDGNVLADKYCRDAHSGSGCHLNNDGFAIWTCVFRNYAYLKQKGLYENPPFMPTYTKNK